MAGATRVNTIPAAVLAQPVTGYNLPANTLGALLQGEPTLLVFLRHFGCIFCREMVADLRAAAVAIPGYPRILFVAHGEPDLAAPFFGDAWPEAQAIVDTERQLYLAFGVERMSNLAVLNPALMACGLRAAGKGHMQGASQGDPKQMPGLFFVQGEKVLWQHDFRNAGDHPDWAALPARLPAVAVRV